MPEASEKITILVIDDEDDLCGILKFNLDKAGYRTVTAHSAEEALLGGLSGVSLILLDVMMDGMSGFRLAELLRGGRETASIPIIFITAKDSEEDVVRGFELGADDYVSKPFSIREVLSRVQAVLRRSCHAAATDGEKAAPVPDGLLVDMDKKICTVDGVQADLTRTELEILNLLVSHPSAVYTREDILDRIWPEGVVVLGRTVDVNITRLRRKLGRFGHCIVTRHGYGYCFENE